MNIQKKVHMARKSCVTPEQKNSYKNYRKLYETYIERESESFGKSFSEDLVYISVIGFALTVGLFCALTSLTNYLLQ